MSKSVYYVLFSLFLLSFLFTPFSPNNLTGELSLKLFAQYADFSQHPYEDVTIDPVNIIKEAPASPSSLPSSSLVEFYKDEGRKDECWFKQVKNEQGLVIFLNFKSCEPSSIECKFDSSRVQKSNEIVNGAKVTKEYFPGVCKKEDLLDGECWKETLEGFNGELLKTRTKDCESNYFCEYDESKKSTRTEKLINTDVKVTRVQGKCTEQKIITKTNATPSAPSDFLRTETGPSKKKPWEEGGMVSPKLDIPWDQQTGYDQVLVQPQQCPANSRLVDDRCLCDMGFESKNGVCIPAIPPEQNCKEVGGNFDQLSNKCIMCPPGLVYQGNGKCGCEKGFEYMGNQCVPACAPPMFRNERAECLSCEQFCQSKGMTTQATDYTPYIQDYLNKNGVCKTNAQIQGGKVLEVKQFNCRCYDPNLPQISISGDAICEPTPCGPVACNSAKSCSCGPGCTVSVACKWFGWKYQGGRFVPVVQGASQQAPQDVQVPVDYQGGYGGAQY